MSRRGFEFSLFHCGRCGARYNSLFGHVCVRKRSGRVRLAPSARSKCRKCGKQYSNPITHVCSNRGDFARRKRAAQRAAKAAKGKQDNAIRQAKVRARVAEAKAREKAKADKRVATVRKAERERGRRRAAATRQRAARPAHDHRSCRDEDCPRQACRVWREAFAEGMEAGAEASSTAGRK